MEIKFNDGVWKAQINVSNFVHENITPYEGDASFLTGPTERTKKNMESVP
jgi:Pyruvate-formate lyase